MSTEGLIKIRIPLLKTDWHSYASETLWTFPLGDSQYELRNSPFFANELSYGDVVYAEIEDEGDFPLFKFVVTRSGHSTYRIVLEEKSTLKDFEKYIKPLNEIGCSTEGFKEQQFTVDVPDTTNIFEAFKLLQVGEDEGIWFFSSAHVGHPINEK
ncbi:MAG: DUF4265 domain-containing protein [Parafilimonas sp.]